MTRNSTLLSLVPTPFPAAFTCLFLSLILYAAVLILAFRAGNLRLIAHCPAVIVWGSPLDARELR